jgi:hypothetical protein
MHVIEYTITVMAAQLSGIFDAFLHGTSYLGHHKVTGKFEVLSTSAFTAYEV